VNLNDGNVNNNDKGNTNYVWPVRGGEWWSCRPPFDNHPLFSMENLYRAYRRCRRHKRGTINALRFEQNLEENLVALHQELTAGTYRPGRSIAFLVEKPKRREIFAADFRDRVVHHVLVGHLEPRWERRFIHDSYACRKGKGTHAGVERLRSFARQATANGTRRAWYLQLDVRGFFMTIDRNVLCERVLAGERDPAVRWLARTLIFHDPVANCRLRHARRSDFEALPAHKTLFKAAPDCGLPIGNLTSQFFANVYLDALDQFVKHELKARWYVRYCDDLVLLSGDRGELERWERAIEAFVGNGSAQPRPPNGPTRAMEGEPVASQGFEGLRLQLNQRRRLRPVADGIDFLGYIVRPDYLLVRRRVVGALRERLQAAEARLTAAGMRVCDDRHSVFAWDRALVQLIGQWLHSYLGHFRRASCRRLIEAMRRRFGWLDEYFRWQRNQPTAEMAAPRAAPTYAAQRGWFARRFQRHVLVMQLGGFWQIVPGRLEERVWLWAWMGLLPTRFPGRDLGLARRLLWHARVPVAWIGETGRRVHSIAERALVERWDFAAPGGVR
jgi:hypothetical protein